MRRLIEITIGLVLVTAAIQALVLVGLVLAKACGIH
jgi:hypothetical protein